MTQNTKTTLMFGGAIVIVSGIAYAIYKSKKNNLFLVDNARVNVTEEGKTTSEGTKPNPFTAMLNNPLPSSIGYTFGGRSTMVNNPPSSSIGYQFGSVANLR